MPSSTRSHAIFECSLSGSLTITGLQHVQFATLNSELHILHISVMIFQSLTYFFEIPGGIRRFRKSM